METTKRCLKTLCFLFLITKKLLSTFLLSNMFYVFFQSWEHKHIFKNSYQAGSKLKEFLSLNHLIRSVYCFECWIYSIPGNKMLRLGIWMDTWFQVDGPSWSYMALVCIRLTYQVIYQVDFEYLIPKLIV